MVFNSNQYNDYTLTSHRRSNSLSNNNNSPLQSNNIIPNSFSNNNISNVRAQIESIKSDELKLNTKEKREEEYELFIYRFD